MLTGCNIVKNLKHWLFKAECNGLRHWDIGTGTEVQQNSSSTFWSFSWSKGCLWLTETRQSGNLKGKQGRKLPRILDMECVRTHRHRERETHIHIHIYIYIYTLCTCMHILMCVRPICEYVRFVCSMYPTPYCQTKPSCSWTQKVSPWIVRQAITLFLLV